MNLDDINRIQRNDQAEQAFESMAIGMGAYYRALLAARIPDDLARKMVRDLARVQWERALSQPTSSQGTSA
jgi:hypothetical protein